VCVCVCVCVCVFVYTGCARGKGVGGWGGVGASRGKLMASRVCRVLEVRFTPRISDFVFRTL